MERPHFFTEIHHALFSKRFLLAVFATILSLFAASWDMIVDVYKAPERLVGGFHDILFFSVTTSELFLMFASLICTITYSSAFVEEYSSGFIKSSLMRNNKQRYTSNKAISVTIAGGSAIGLGAICFYLLTVIILKFIEPINEQYTFNFTLLISRIYVLFLFGAIFALIGGIISTSLLSRYVAYIAPFIIYYIPVILCERYIPSIYVINPREWVSMSKYWPLGVLGLLLFLIELTTLLYLLFIVEMRRKLEKM